MLPPLVLPNEELALHSREKRQIKNNMDRGIPAIGRVMETRDAITQYISTTARTRKPCLKYNCHGLTFASRRTAITDTSEVQKIIKDDGYEQIPTAGVLPGDVAIWRAPPRQGGEIIHSGIVVEVPARNGIALSVPVVVSKWGGMHEAIHRINDCPYNGTVEYYRVVP